MVMAAKDSMSLQQFQNLIEWHGGTAFPHPEGGIEVTLSQRLGQRWGMGNSHRMEDLDESHPVVQKVLEESKKEGLL
jgi:hypothetical protein